MRYKSSIMFLDTAKLNAQIRENHIEKVRLQKMCARMDDLVRFGVASENVIEVNRYLSLQPRQLAEKLNKLMFASQKFSAVVHEAVSGTPGFLEQVEPALRAHVVRQDQTGVIKLLALVNVLLVGAAQAGKETPEALRLEKVQRDVVCVLLSQPLQRLRAGALQTFALVARSPYCVVLAQLLNTSFADQQLALIGYERDYAVG